jgi:hypothetical protein
MNHLAIIAFDNGGVLAMDYVPLGHTINGKYYETFLKKKLRPAIRKKQPALLKSGVLLIYDNATQYKSHPMTSKIEE